MITLKRFALATVATLLVAAACTSIPTIPTIPPLGGIPGFTIPPIIGLPGVSIPPGSTPCQIVTAAEVGQIIGSTVSDETTDATDCSFLLPNFTAVSVQVSSSTDLSGVQFLLGTSAQQSQIGGFPALSGVVFGQPTVYVQKGGSQLQVLGVLLGSDPATITKLQQIATIAVGRLP